MQRNLGRIVASMTNYEYRAVDGRVSITDKRDGNYTTISYTEAMQKFAEIRDEVMPTVQRKYPGDRKDIEKFLRKMEAVIREAQEQGPPEYDDVMRDKVRRRKMQVLLERGIGP